METVARQLINYSRVPCAELRHGLDMRGWRIEYAMRRANSGAPWPAA